MPAKRGVKRTASKASASTTSSAPKNKKKRGTSPLKIPTISTSQGRVLACGQGDVGQLGLGEDVMEATRYKYVSGLGDSIVSLCAGGMHSVALNFKGEVYTFGCNDEGALGRQTTAEGSETLPGSVTLPSPAVRITAGDSHSAALLDDGHVYAWGSFRDSHGSMGLVIQGRDNITCKEPVKINVGEPAVDIASGSDHLVILGASGSIYTMGCGEQGQLGRLAQRSATRDARQGFSALLTPSKVTLRGGASKVWAGYHATFAINAAGDKLLAWGLNNYGQLGISGEKRKTAIFGPTECDVMSSDGWSQIACGQHHTLAIDKQGLGHAIGRCEYGRLGLGNNTTDAETLTPIPKLENKKCIRIAAGTSSSYAVTSKGEVFVWGMNSENQLGNGKTEDVFEPMACNLTSATFHTPGDISAGGQHALILLLKDNGETAPVSTPMDVDTIDKPVTIKTTDTIPEEKNVEDKVEPMDDKKTEVTEKVQPKLDDVDQQKPQANSTNTDAKTTEVKIEEKVTENKNEKIDTTNVDKKIEDNKAENTKIDDNKTENTKIDENKTEQSKINEDQKSEPNKTAENVPETQTIDKQKAEEKTEVNNSEDIEMKEVKPEEVNGNPISPETVSEKTKTVQDALNTEKDVPTTL